MNARARNASVFLILLVVVTVLLLLTQCYRTPVVAHAAPSSEAPAAPAVPAVDRVSPDEVLTSATLELAHEVAAGAAFTVEWDGPDNRGDYLAVARPAMASREYAYYRDTREGHALKLVAPMEAGEWEVRYVTGRSKTILGRAPLRVLPVEATLTAENEIMIGASLRIDWSGPNNSGDFIQIVTRGAPDHAVGSYVETKDGSPVVIPAPVEGGEAEIRYVSGQGRMVLARRPLLVRDARVGLMAADNVIAGGMVEVSWTGPANRGDYLTIVPRTTPDGQYRNYRDVSHGETLALTAPIEPGEAEIRYMSGQGARVLARRNIRVTSPEIVLQATTQCVAGSVVEIKWEGPNNANDYITIVPQRIPDGGYGNYTNTARGSPLTVTAPIEPGTAEIRYMSGQGARVLARSSITVVPASISVRAPEVAKPESTISIDWTGPNHQGDYLTIVPKNARDGIALRVAYTARGSPAKVGTPKEAGPCEIRYMSGQKNQVLARVDIDVR